MEKLVIDVNEPEEEIVLMKDELQAAELGEILEPPFDFYPEEIDEVDPDAAPVK